VWAILLALAAGCGSTRLVDTWTDPGAHGTALSRIAVIYMTMDDTNRRVAEDAAVRALAAKLEGAQAAVSYTLLVARTKSEWESLRQKLDLAGFDGALIMRPAGVSHRLVSEPGTFFPSFSGYWQWAYPMVYQPSYLREETTVRLDTRLYALKEDKLLWAGLSDTSDPSSINHLVHEVAIKVAKALEKSDLVAGLGGGAAGSLHAVRSGGRGPQ
jgi:hypothetical protein